MVWTLQTLVYMIYAVNLPSYLRWAFFHSPTLLNQYSTVLLPSLKKHCKTAIQSFWTPSQRCFVRALKFPSFKSCIHIAWNKHMLSFKCLASLNREIHKSKWLQCHRYFLIIWSCQLYHSLTLILELCYNWINYMTYLVFNNEYQITLPAYCVNIWVNIQ